MVKAVKSRQSKRMPATWVKALSYDALPLQTIAETVKEYAETGSCPMLFDGTPMDLAHELYTLWCKRSTVVFGGFMTPPWAAKWLARLLDLHAYDVVLDPCAGIGSLVYAAIDNGAQSAGFEIQPGVVEIARALGLNVQCIDFLNQVNLPEVLEITAVMINPPFGNMLGHADIAVPFLEKVLAYHVPVAAILPYGWWEKTPKKYARIRDSYAVLQRETLDATTFLPLSRIVTEMMLLEPQI